LALGWGSSEIVFAGSGKTIREITFALSNNSGILHCECMEEWQLVQSLKAELDATTLIALRINPDLRVDTHEKISTGEKKNKFGMSFS